MFVLAWRALAATAAAATLVAAWLWSPAPTPETSVALGTVLENLANAKTLHLSVTMAGKTAEVWATKANYLRWNNPDGTYQIARGSRLWLVDEKANRAASQACTFFRGEKPKLDTLALLGLPEPKDRQRLLESRPLKRVRHDGLDCDLYRVEFTAPQGKVRIEALVDPATQVLRALETEVDRDGKVEPLAKLTVLGVDQPVQEELFVVGDTLTEDGRIGKVIDAQGVVSIKPVMANRWTPLAEGLVLKPGDWLQTDLRGANAVALRLVPQTRVTLGPGALVELVKPNQVRIASGDVKIVAGAKGPVEVHGPGQQKAEVKDTAIFRIEREKLVRLAEEPQWLRSFEGRAVGESIGSLEVTIDGRNTPLTVGYHKVTVDIRDQIARTVIEESFVNHTDGRLEGVFHFPLPQDASISGFGMWIGDKLVEADVVEKQRAREIYEIILRERRDPGLLEWSGGNIFKARVFPIEAHSEKRIKITYTQVLPLRGNSYRYSYALQSEMLKQHPLRELTIEVKLNSVMPLGSVTCPTHTTRTDRTRHSAHVEFAAQEYTPTRDFEVVVEVDGRQSEVVLIPHRRGEDGYFMLLVTPPVGAISNRPYGVDAQREILPEGEPLDLLVLADTSASLDVRDRTAQAEFIAALLGALTPRDTVNLACCDVECDWAFEKSQPAEAKNITAARQFLAGRISLGWTDLDKAFAAVLARCGSKTRVVYVGDGIPTTGDADPVAFGKRLRRLYEGKKGTFYSVSVGSSFESGVLRTIASLGGGSMRQISGEHGPRAVALELLGEIARPAIRDLKVEFRGLRTARVYPQELPNIPAGSQQILLGRYLPQGTDQSGEVIVTGMQGDKPVRFAAQVSLKDAEQGNSFIPRLWARMYLDSLLQQGSSQAIQDEIIAMSEEYHIITPYTSLLVLESDADRERFKVTRRFLMRDGEKFFREGRENANYELVQQQMKRAGNWRLGLRRSALQQFSALGRQPQMFLPPARYRRTTDWYENSRRAIGGSYDWNVTGWEGGEGYVFAHAANLSVTASDAEYEDRSGLRALGALGLGVPHFGGFDADADDKLGAVADTPASVENFDEGEKDRSSEPSERMISEKVAFHDRLAQEPMTEGEMESSYREEAGLLPQSSAEAAFAPMADARMNYPDGATALSALGYLGAGVTKMPSLDARYNFGFGVNSELGLYWRDDWRGGRVAQPVQWLNTLFPAIPAPPAKEPELKERWPADARVLAQSLLRNEQLAQLKGGLEIERQGDNYDARWNELTSRWQSLALVSPAAWLMRSEYDNSQTVVQWCDAKQRGIYGTAFQLGRLRTSAPADLSKPPLDLSGHVLSSLERTYAGYAVEVRPQADGLTLLVLKHPNSPTYEVHVLIDTKRHVILTIEQRNEGKVTSTEKYGDFVEVAGCWWAGRIESVNGEGSRLWLITQKFAPLETAAFAERIKQELADKQQVQFLREPALKISEAKRAVAAGKPTFDDQITLLVHFARSQQWTRVLGHLEQAEQLSAGKPGLRWVRNAVLNEGRRRGELKKRILEEAAQMAKPQPGRTAGNERFLADHLINQSSGILEPNEMLALLDALLPVYQRQPAYLRAMRHWTGPRINYLRNVGRSDEALQLEKQLAGAYPHDYNVQQQYAQSLANAGEYEAAYAWLERTLGGGIKWLPYEEQSLRDTYVRLMESEGRYAELLDRLAAWIKQNPETSTFYQQYLGALVRTNRLDEADKLVAQWLKEGQVAGRLPPPVAARLEAAISLALGQGYNVYTNRIEERWLKPLAEAARFFARHEFQVYTADRIMGNGNFQQSDECRGVRKAIVAILTSEMGKLPTDRIRYYVNWIMPNDPAIEPQVWKQIASELQKRWSAEPKPELKHQIAQTLIQVLARGDARELLDFLRLQVQQGPEQYRAQYVRQLFDTLLGQPWSQDYEDEACSLLEKLSDAPEPQQRLVVAVAALHRLTDRMVAARFQEKMKAIEHSEELPRPELRAKQAENLRLSREGFADRLGREIGKRPGALAAWMNIERLYLDVVVGRNLKKATEECWEALGPQPRKAPAEDDPQQWLEEALRNRFLLTLCNLAARKDAEPALVERLLKYLDQGIALEDEDLRWKLLKYELLIALDRPKDLEQALQAWIRAEGPINRWRVSLGYLLAEQGKISEAIGLFEAVAAADELGPVEYRTLADWYMALNRRAEYERAVISSYKTLQEHQLYNLIAARLRPWQRGDGKMPSELDKEVLLIFAALFEKSSSPQSYLSQVQQFYQATRDFQLLSGLADAVVGHTAGQVYPFLQGMRSVLGEVGDEATVDSIVEYLGKVRARARTTVDQRALDLRELRAERRAAELLNQPGPHAQRALAALERAFKREWSPGEGRLMADFLEALGNISQAKLAQEQVRQLQTLHQRETKGSLDRLHIAWRLAQTLWNYSRWNEAIDLLQMSVDEYQDASNGVLPASVNHVLDTYVSYLEQRGHYARGEKVLFAQLKHPANQQQTYWLVQRQYRLYHNAIADGGDVSLGSGATLYKAVERKLIGELGTPDHNHRAQLLNWLCSIYRAAHNKKFPGVVEDLRAFAFKKVPEVLKRQTTNYSSLVSQVAHTLHDLAGPRDGLAFLIERIEQEPGWLRYNSDDGWQRHGGSLGQWRTEVREPLGELEPRLLKIVLAELRQDLQSRQARNRSMYHRQYNSSYYWEAKENDFAQVAEQVYAERKQSGVSVAYIADYLYNGLHRCDRAIEMLLIAYKDKLLEQSAQAQLVTYLHERNRHGESIAILQAMIERWPENMQYRVWLMHAYFRTHRPKELLGLLEQTDEYFHQKGRWTEAAMASLGESCLENELFAQSVKYYKELIPLHERTHQRRGIGSDTLSRYYMNLAQAYCGLQQIAEAVDAACGGIVSWGPRHDRRAAALGVLRDVLRKAPNLDAYVAELDKKTAATKLQNPLVRKALGQVYLDRKQYAQAIAQLKLACELQPNDTETHQALVACYDAQGDKQGAVRQLLESLQLARRDIKLYEDLGRRLSELGQPQETERAYTSIVEMLQSESESHTLLAEIRQKQNRWAEAIVQWEQVSRIRALEPTGLLGLAAAQIHEKQWDHAAETVSKLRARTWPSRFGDVPGQIRQLEQQIDQGRKK